MSTLITVGHDPHAEGSVVTLFDGQAERLMVASFEGTAPPITPLQFSALIEARRRVGRPLGDEEARSVVSQHSVDGGDDGHR